MVLELLADIKFSWILCTGEKVTGSTIEKPLHFKGWHFHQITKKLMVQGRNFSSQNGIDGEITYGEKFKDENSLQAWSGRFAEHGKCKAPIQLGHS